MIILGLNAYHGDSSACIVVDGKLIAAVEEERFRRIKHWAGFPSEAIKYCLKQADVEIKDIDHMAVNRNPNANLLRKALFTLSKRPSFAMVKDRLLNTLKIKSIKTVMYNALSVKSEDVKAEIHNIEHHKAHLASSFFVSPYEEATLLSVDGFGDFVSAMMGVGKGNRIDVFDRVTFPHSLGQFYLALTQFLGFPKYGDEYKVMGLAALGKPIYLDKMRKIVKLDGNFKLNLDYFIHHSEGVSMTWDGGEPKMGPTYSERMIKEFGLPRKWEDPITEHHQNIASSLQAMYEEAFFHILNTLYKKTKNTTLCLSGGCAMNSVANGKIFDNTPFKNIYIQSAAGDAGGAIGAAYYVYHQVFGNKRNFVMDTSYWGPQFGEKEVEEFLKLRREELDKAGCIIENIKNEDELCKKTAKEIADGKIVGWFQGRTEWGPRALGNRSIVDPRRHNMKDILNSRIKRRETLFRPFAPSILLEAIGEYFEKDYPDPFMIKVYPIRAEKRSEIPAVTHVDGTGRLQTVRREDNPLYWKLIKEFENLTGVPVVLNTSFNENEPIVCTPEEALNCFLRTKMDVLVMGNFFIDRS
ncbi:MAG: Decarbamoylnovobiocin carbamoyltransferase [candidate division WS2 bacterium]|nr:Decarbamoylnovobiocin carbamoyltransferase [Candidatus Psychracetigena formicireducens]